MAKPLTPQEVAQQKQDSIPDAVIEVVNALLVKKWNRNNRTATIKQDDIVAAIVAKMGVSNQEVFNQGWLDFEDAFRAQGWKVKYDKPAYCEDYDAFFEFKEIPRQTGGSWRD